MKEKTTFGIIASLVWIYLVLRAIFVQPIHDEIATFFTFVQSGRFIPYFSDWTTNNHFLNSLLTSISYRLFGPWPVSLRLANLLAFPVFAFFLWKISTRLHQRMLRWGFLLIILGTHTFIEFFALSRGYGLSFAMLTGGIWYTMQALERPATGRYLPALLLVLLSASAILINVNSLIIISILLLLRALIRSSGEQFNSGGPVISVFLAGFIPVIFIAKYLLDLSTKGRLDYGETGNFWTASVKDLTPILTAKHTGWLEMYILIATVALTLIFIILFVKKIHRKNLSAAIFYPHWIFVYLLFGNIAGFILEHVLFGVLYPANRTMLQFVILFSGSLFFVTDETEKPYRSWLSLILLPLLFFPVQFFFTANFSKVTIENERIPARFMDTVANTRIDGRYLPTVQGYRGRELRWGYLNFLRGDSVTVLNRSSHPSLEADFQIVYPDSLPGWQTFYQPVDSDAVSGLNLLKRKHPLQRIPLLSDQQARPVENSVQPYFGIARGSADTLGGNDLYISFNCRIRAAKKDYYGWLVFAVFDAKGQQLAYERIPLNWYRRNWRSDTTALHTGMLVVNIPEKAATWRCYLWNIHQVHTTVDELECSLFELKK